MICVSINEKNYNNAIEIASLYDFAEIRIDLLETVENKIVKKIFSSHKNLIATYRKKDESDAKRLSILKTAIESGAAYIDIDINEGKKFISFAKSLCKDKNQQLSKGRKNTNLIISYHNFEETPTLDILDKVITEAIANGADIVKIACTIKNKTDIERLLSLPDYYSPVKIVIAGMGEKGGRVRVLAETAGSFFTYASHDKKSSTAEGQLDYKTLVKEQGKIVSGW